MSKLDEFLTEKIAGILRPPTGFLRHPFLVPGGIFHDELWDWDSFWISKAVLGAPCLRESAVRAEFLQHAMGSWRNFFEHQGASGAVPIMVKSDRPDFFGCTTGEVEMNQAKPVFGQFALEISRAAGNAEWLREYFDGLLLFYRRWLDRYRSRCGLLVWGSDVAIGVDCDPATYGRPEFSSANLLLNGLFHRDVLAAAELAIQIGRDSDAAHLRAEAAGIASALQRECWDESDGFFYSVDVSCADHRDRYLPGLNKGMAMTWQTLPLKVKMFTGFLPMWCGIATPRQADRLVKEHLQNDAEFNAAWGIRSLAKTERMYDPETDSANPSNWLGPVWIIANYLVYDALNRYGFHANAKAVADKTRRLLERDLELTGTLHECYHPETGTPNFNGGFLSWNLLALVMEPRRRETGKGSSTGLATLSAAKPFPPPCKPAPSPSPSSKF